MSTERIKTFDSVRAIATILVFVFHVGYLLQFADTSVINRYTPGTIINWHRVTYICGTVGVSLFFTLSGFLLFYQMYKKREALTWAGVKEYAKKRLLRILPLYYVSILIIVLFFRPYILSAAGGVESILYNLVFLRPFRADGTPKVTINPVYWSLVVEMHFYFLLPIFYAIFYRFQRVFWFLLVALAGIIYRLAVITLIDNPSMQFLRLTPANFDFFAFGMLGAYLFVRREQWLERISNLPMQIGLTILWILFVYFYDLEFGSTWSYVFMPTLFGLITTMTMLAFLLNERTWLARVSTWSPMLFIAQISFSIYVWHTMIVEKMELLPISNLTKFGLTIIGTLALSVITYYLVEAPFLRTKPKPKETPINEGM